MIKNIDGLIKHVTVEIKKFTDISVIGLSGGADSTLVAILNKMALGKDNVYGIHMPYNQLDRDTFNSKSIKLATHLGINQRDIDIGNAVDTLLEQFTSPLSTLNKGNMRSRMRMVALYTICCQIAEETGQAVRVVGTDNLSESYIGFFTKFGDGGCDYFPIGSLVKSEVYQLLEHFRDQGDITEEMIDRIPSAGLWSNQTDESELGYTYDEMESHVLRGVNIGILDTSSSVGKFVWDRHIAGEHKGKAVPVVELRKFCT